jgi:hypothetical protein
MLKKKLSHDLGATLSDSHVYVNEKKRRGKLRRKWVESGPTHEEFF